MAEQNLILNILTFTNPVETAEFFFSAKKAHPQANTLPSEAEIDARVFHLHGLSKEEMLQVLNSLPSVSEGEHEEILAK